MANYTIQMNYNASIVVEVSAENEGEALDLARDKAILSESFLNCLSQFMA